MRRSALKRRSRKHDYLIARAMGLPFRPIAGAVIQFGASGSDPIVYTSSVLNYSGMTPVGDVIVDTEGFFIAQEFKLPYAIDNDDRIDQATPHLVPPINVVFNPFLPIGITLDDTGTVVKVGIGINNQAPDSPVSLQVNYALFVLPQED